MAAEMDVMRRERGHPLGNPLFRTKSIEGILADSGAPEHRLKRTLTAWDLTGLGIGAIIGTGIFVLIGTAIVGDAHRPGAGPGIMVSFILSGITCALAALCHPAGNKGADVSWPGIVRMARERLIFPVRA